MTSTTQNTCLPLPPGDLGLPFIGKTLEALRDFPGFNQRNREKYGNIFKTRLFGKNFICLLETEANKFILLNENNYFTNDTFANSKHIFGTNSLTWQKGKEHQKNRQSLSQPFQSQAFEQYLSTIQTITRNYLQKWEKDKQLTWHPELKKYSFDILSKLLVGIDSASQTELLPSLEAMGSGLVAIPWQTPWTKYGRALEGRKKVLQFIREAIEKVKKENDLGANILEILIQVSEQDGNHFSLIELPEQIISLLFLGYKELSSALTSFCLLSAQHPETLEKIIWEQKEIGELEPLTLIKLKQMTYLEQVLKEVIRVIPPVGAGIRKVIKECDYQGYRIPSGWTVVYGIESTHQDSQLYSEPFKFDPERFNPERAEDKKKPFGYIPFGGGPRECLGKNFAFLVMKIFVATLVREYAWKLLPDQDLTLVNFGSPTPKDELKVNFTKLNTL